MKNDAEIKTYRNVCAEINKRDYRIGTLAWLTINKTILAAQIESIEASLDGPEPAGKETFKDQYLSQFKTPCCGHGADAIFWNDFNKCVQCHACGQTYKIIDAKGAK
jgi:hypothetical protein